MLVGAISTGRAIDLYATPVDLYGGAVSGSNRSGRDRVRESAGARALLSALAELGGSAAPGELDELTGMAASTRSKWIGQLRAIGFVDGPKGRVQLTPAGWEVIDQAPALPAVQLELAAAIDYWPTPAHQAFVRLAIAGVIARRHLGRTVRTGHPGFIATGRTGSGKTTAARFVCDVFGLDHASAIVSLPRAIGGEILGRHDRSEDGWRFLPSSLLALPLVVFDEFDKADTALQRDALLYFQDDTELVREGTRLTLLAAPLLTCNKRPGGRLPVPDEYRRRAVVLDTDALVDQLDELDLRLRELTDAGGPPRLEVDKLRPPAQRLPREAFDLLRGLLRRGLTADGWTLVSLPSLELLALGYAPLMGDTPIGASVIAAARDYLTCAETVGETVPGWQRGFGLAARAVIGGADVAAALELGADDQLAIEARHQDRRTSRVRADDALTVRRAELVTELQLAERDVDGRKLQRIARERQVAGGGIRAALRKLREEAGDARSLETLGDVDARARGVLRDAQQLVDAIAADKIAAAAAGMDSTRSIQSAGERAAFTKRMQAIQSEEQKRLRREWTAWRSRLGKLVPYASDDELLAGLAALELAMPRRATEADFGGGITGKLALLSGSRISWVNRATGRVIYNAAAFWQDAYDHANAQVVRYGGAARAKRAISRRRRAA